MLWLYSGSIRFSPMKPKRRSTFSPPAPSKPPIIDSPSHSPRSKRRRQDSTSPVRRKSSNGSDTVRPPPEFSPIDYMHSCPKFAEALGRDQDRHPIDNNDLLQLQYDLEMMLAHAGDFCRRAHGEVTFLTSGDYPMQNLQDRPMPSYKLREMPVASPSSSHEQQGLCGLPVEENEDNIDIWPPHHMPTRFWTWCKHDFMQNITSDTLKDFKELILDQYSAEGFKEYMVNEPWKHRKRANGRMRLASIGSSSGGKRRRASGEDKKMVEKEPATITPCRKSRSSRDRIPSLIGNVVDMVCREMKHEGDVPMSPSVASPAASQISPLGRRMSGRLQSRDDGELEKKVFIKLEPPDDYQDIELTSLDLYDKEDNDPTPRSPRITSPRIKRDYDEEEFDWDSPGPSTSYGHANGKCNGDSTATPKKRNGEKKPNGYLSNVNGNNGHLNGIKSPTVEVEEVESDDVEIEEFRTYRNIGEKILTNLIDMGLVPEYASYAYGNTKAETDVEISTEGKEPTDDDELDEVSEELLRCQQELKDLEPDMKGIAEHCFHKLKSDFAYFETAAQLSDADHDLFRLGVNMYKELPRRQPAPAEWPTLSAAVRRRNGKARTHYAHLYKRQPDFFVDGLEDIL